MAQEIGESREAWGLKVMQLVEDFSNQMKQETKPYYIVYAAKPDAGQPGVFRQTIKAYYHRPPALLGILVWYVDNRHGILRLVPELSSPPDVPLDPKLLSDKAEDASARVMAQGEKMKVLVS